MTNRGVLFVGNFLSGRTAHRHYCEDLSERLEARRWRVIRTSQHAGRARRLVDMLEVTWRRRHDYDVAHIDLFSGPAFVWAEAVALELRVLGKPYAITLHGGTLPEFAARWPRRVRRLLGSATVVTSPSSYLRDRMAPYARAITVIPNGVELARYPFQVRARPRPRLVWIRAFHHVYNPLLAIEVLARVLQRHPDASLTMVGADTGDGALAAVERSAQDLNVAGSLQLVRGVPHCEVPQYLADADVFLNTTNVDNTPVSVLEAMSCGLCVISTSVGGIPRLVDHEREAILVPPRDPQAMTAAVDRILVDASLAARLSSAAHERAAEHDWAKVADRWEEQLEHLRQRA